MNYKVCIEDVKAENGEPLYHSDGELKPVYIENLPNTYKVYKEVFKASESRYWAFIRVHIHENNQEILTFDRNYPSLPESIYVKQCGKEFIITSGDYQTVTIVNLTDLTMESYCNEYRHEKGWGFCPIEFNSSYDIDDSDDEEIELRITGCYWGGSYETYIFPNIDLLNPNLDFSTAECIPEDPEDDYDDDDEEDEEYE